MESAYTLAAKELSDIQTENKMQMEYRHSEVCAKIPDFLDIESELVSFGTLLLKSVLHNGKDYETIKKGIQEKQALKKTLLKKKWFSRGLS